jgi:hypothetical protein
MNILDAVIIVFLLIGALAGYRRGLVKQAVLLVGLVVVLVLSFYIRVPVSTFFYKNLPFFNFDGLFHGISVLNILLYDGTVLVYERKNKPNTSNKRKYASSNSDGGGYVNYGTGFVDGGTGSSGSTKNNKRNPNDDYYEYQCGFCNGTGRVTINQSKNMGNFGIGNVEKVRCHECGKEYDSNATVHRHETCSKCHGKGKIRERLR